MPVDLSSDNTINVILIAPGSTNSSAPKPRRSRPYKSIAQLVEGPYKQKRIKRERQEAERRAAEAAGMTIPAMVKRMGPSPKKNVQTGISSNGGDTNKGDTEETDNGTSDKTSN